MKGKITLCQYESDFKCLPVRKVLDGNWCVWETELVANGWNDLPAPEKIGEIVEVYRIDGGGHVVDIRFGGCGIAAKSVFLNEIRPLEKDRQFAVARDKETGEAGLYLVEESKENADERKRLNGEH